MKASKLILAAAAMLALPAVSVAQQGQYGGHMHQGQMQQGMMMNGAGRPMMMGMGMMGMWLQPGPQFMLDQKDALDLTGEQVQQLEKLQSDLSAARDNHVDRVAALRKDVNDALSGDQPDLDEYQSALESLANEYISMQVERARYSQKALAVLNDTQRSYVNFGMRMMDQMGEYMWRRGQMYGGMMHPGMMNWDRSGGSGS
ncbi:MAG: hypothetical protein PVI01_07675 [Gemmatimonadales bacterium]|jgi:Spy/CpxP family protein refolding chaperone